jgi:hypothetical protein
MVACRNIFSHPAYSGADRGPGLVLGDGLGQNQLCAQTKSSGQAGAAIDNGDGHRVIAIFSATAHIKDQLSGGQVFAIDQNQVETLRVQFLSSGDTVEGPLASY